MNDRVCEEGDTGAQPQVAPAESDPFARNSENPCPDCEKDPQVQDEPAPEVTHENNENIQNLGAEGEEIIETNPNGPQYNTGNVVMRLSVYNFNKHKIKIEAQLKSESEAPNCFVPYDKIRADVYTEKNKALCYFHKIHPTKPFGEISFEFEELDKKEKEEKPANSAAEVSFPHFDMI